VLIVSEPSLEPLEARLIFVRLPLFLVNLKMLLDRLSALFRIGDWKRIRLPLRGFLWEPRRLVSSL
jgi:hypothetical protein